MKWKLYIDDLRTPVDATFIIARSVEDAQKLIRTCGVPTFISFDHDLGIDDNGSLLPTGYDFVLWLVQMDIEGEFLFPENFDYKVHSQNPEGAKNIREFLRSYLSLRNQCNQVDLMISDTNDVKLTLDKFSKFPNINKEISPLVSLMVKRMLTSSENKKALEEIFMLERNIKRKLKH